MCYNSNFLTFNTLSCSHLTFSAVSNTDRESFVYIRWRNLKHNQSVWRCHETGPIQFFCKQIFCIEKEREKTIHFRFKKSAISDAKKTNIVECKHEIFLTSLPNAIKLACVFCDPIL